MINVAKNVTTHGRIRIATIIRFISVAAWAKKIMSSAMNIKLTHPVPSMPSRFRSLVVP